MSLNPNTIRLKIPALQFYMPVMNVKPCLYLSFSFTFSPVFSIVVSYSFSCSLLLFPFPVAFPHCFYVNLHYCCFHVPFIFIWRLAPPFPFPCPCCFPFPFVFLHFHCTVFFHSFGCGAWRHLFLVLVAFLYFFFTFTLSFGAWRLAPSLPLLSPLHAIFLKIALLLVFQLPFAVQVVL